MEGQDNINNRLPQRLFATDRYPCHRHNIYSKPDYLAFIRHVLRDTKEFDIIRASCFGKLFDLPARQCLVSAKLIHSFLTRQLLCVDNHTLWSAFGGKPLRFGLQEFGTLTGLPCGAFPPGYNPATKTSIDPRKEPIWVSLIGKKRFTTIEELAHKLESDRNMTSWKKVRLALIIIVDGVLIAHEQKPRPTLRFVKLLEELDVFFSHPWGRESFLKTIACMKPPKFDKQSCKDPPAKLVECLKQETYRLQGFPLSLQLLAFAAVPKLLSIIQAPYDTLTIMDLVEDHLPIHPPVSTLDIHGVEADPKLVVTALIPVDAQPEPGWGIWPDVCDDDRVAYMEQRIADEQPFTKDMWPGGDTSEPFITFPSVVVSHENKNRSTRSKKPCVKNIKLRHSIKQTSSSRKQRRISTFFSRAAPSISQHEQVLALISSLSSQFGDFQQQFNSFRKQLRLRTRRTSYKRSSFHSLISSSKTCNRSDKGCQTDPTWMNQDATDNSLPKPQMENNLQPFPSFPASETSPKTQGNQHGQTNPKVVSSVDIENDMDVDATASLAPLISQYAVQHYLRKESTPAPVHTQYQNNTSVHNSPEHNSPVHNSPLHNSPVHSSPVHNSPVHNSPVHSSPVHDSPVHSSRVHSSPVHDSPVHTTPVHNSPLHNSPFLSPVPDKGSTVQDYNEEIQKSPLPTPSPLYDTSAPPLDLHLSPPDTPICVDPITPTKPKYDSSVGPSSRMACLFPLPPQSCSLESSPTKIPGFAVHAAGVNAFSATSTSHSPVSKPNVHLDDERATNWLNQAVPSPDVVELSDCEGTPPRQRPPYIPCIEENYVAKELYKCKDIPAPTLICQLPQIQWDLFYKSISKFGDAFHETPSKLSFSNNFLLEIAVPKQWTKTYHMVMLMHMLSERHAELLQTQKICFTTPYLTSGIQEIYPRFSRSRKKETFNWDKQLSDIVLMPGRKWMEDVTTVYTPMIWDDRHWVGLATNLDLGLVEILDPMPDLYNDKKVVRFMNPVLKSLPYLVKKLANYELTQFRKLDPFSWNRPNDIYKNERSGDCGPVSVKFIEMHAHGDPEPTMSGITDKLVDAFRKQYVLDLYKTVVLPAYYREPTIDNTGAIGD